MQNGNASNPKSQDSKSRQRLAEPFEPIPSNPPSSNPPLSNPPPPPSQPPYYPIQPPPQSYYSWEMFPHIVRDLIEEKKSKKPLFALIGIFLIITAAFEFPVAAMLMYYSSSEEIDFGDTLLLQGTISTKNETEETELSGVRVSIVGTDLFAISDNNGDYRIPNAPTGIWKITASREGYKEETFKILIHRSYADRVDFIMEEGDGENDFNGLWFFYTLAILMVMFSPFIIAGAFYSFKRKRFSVVLVGAILGMFTMGLPITLWAIPSISLLGALGFSLSCYALLLLVKNRKDFTEPDEPSEYKDDGPI